MITQSPTPAATRVGRGPVSVPRVRSIAALVVLSFAILTASAQAHIGDASATCNSVTITWTKFAASGTAMARPTSPTWTIVFTPPEAEATTTKTGTVSFQGTSFSHTEPIPGGNGSVVLTSSWTSNDTRDHNAGSFSRHLTIANCPVIVPVIVPPRPRPRRPPPPPVTRAPAHAVDNGVGRCGTRWGDPRHGHAEWRVVADGHDHVRALRRERHHVLDGAVHRHRGGQRRRQLRLAGGHARGVRAPTSGSRPIAATPGTRAPRPRATTPPSRRPWPRSSCSRPACRRRWSCAVSPPRCGSRCRFT